MSIQRDYQWSELNDDERVDLIDQLRLEKFNWKRISEVIEVIPRTLFRWRERMDYYQDNHMGVQKISNEVLDEILSTQLRIFDYPTNGARTIQQSTLNAELGFKVSKKQF